MHNPTTATGGCLIGVLRRLLFSGTLPTHPSDHETASQRSDTNCGTESPAPSLVARLMGLDSMPDFPTIHPKKPTNSVNSADCDREREPHLCVKTSVSFWEMPMFLDQENDEYLVLSFENEESKPKQRKSDMGFGRVKRTRAEERENRQEQVICKVKKKRNRETENRGFYNNGGAIVDATSMSPLSVETLKAKDISESKQSRRSRRRKKKKKVSSCGGAIQKLEAECSSEDSSPVSVLDVGQVFPVDPQFLQDEDSRTADSNSRKELEPKLEKHEQPSPSDRETKESYMHMWGSACRLAEGDTVMESNWPYTKSCSFEDLGDVCKDLQTQLLDQLFQELVLDL